MLRAEEEQPHHEGPDSMIHEIHAQAAEPGPRASTSAEMLDGRAEFAGDGLGLVLDRSCCLGVCSIKGLIEIIIVIDADVDVRMSVFDSRQGRYDMSVGVVHLNVR